MTTLPIIFEWYFDSSCPGSESDSLISALDEAVTNWAEGMAPGLIDELVRKPQRNFAVCIQGSSAKEIRVHVLMTLAITRHDLPVCLVHVGPEEFIRNKGIQLKEHYTRQAAVPGNDATIVEHGDIHGP
jgi:hypothetical protein